MSSLDYFEYIYVVSSFKCQLGLKQLTYNILFCLYSLFILMKTGVTCHPLDFLAMPVTILLLQLLFSVYYRNIHEALYQSWPDAVLARLRRWPSIEPTMAECLLFAMYSAVRLYIPTGNTTSLRR